jgi:hypothetical protein
VAEEVDGVEAESEEDAATERPQGPGKRSLAVIARAKVGSLTAARARSTKKWKEDTMDGLDAVKALAHLWRRMNENPDEEFSAVRWFQANPDKFYPLYFGKMVPNSISGVDGGDIVIQLKPPP